MHATEMKTKRHYTSPVTCRATVELEGGFCGSVVLDDTRQVEAKGHEVGGDYAFDNDGSASGNDTSFSMTWD